MVNFIKYESMPQANAELSDLDVNQQNRLDRQFF